MSDDASPSSTARIQDPLLSRSNDDEDAAAAADQDARDVASDRNDESATPSRSRTRERRKKKSKKKRSPGLVKKLAFVTHLLKTLDLVVFAELSGLYYMECSIFRFILRSFPQFVYLTPKDEAWPFLMPASRLHVLLVLIPNIVCMLLHLFSSRPEGPDYHRGYQHGGLIIDFVGQKPPTWRMYYVLVDFAILFIQCLMLAIHTEREKLRVALKTFRPLFPELTQELANARTAQDIDAEEQGILRDTTTSVTDDTNGIELRPLRPGGDALRSSRPSRRTGERRRRRRRNSSADDSPRTHYSDIMSSGNAVIGDYYVVHSLRVAAFDFERTAAHSLRSIGYEATMAALQAQRRAANADALAERPTG